MRNEDFQMFDDFPLTTVVDCNNIIYSYYCPNYNDLSVLSITDPAHRLQYLLATNFIEDYMVTHYTLMIPTSEIGTNLKDRIESLLAHFCEKDIAYLALLDLSEQSSDECLAKIRLIINQSIQLEPKQLSAIWGYNITSESSVFEDVITLYQNALQSIENKHKAYLFTGNLKKPKFIYQGRACAYDDKKELKYAQWTNTFQFIDRSYGRVYVTEYLNI